MATSKKKVKTSAASKAISGGYESYVATADQAIALELANSVSPFQIEVRFMGGLTQTQMDVFKIAAERWSRVIVGDLPSVLVEGEVIDDLVILAQGVAIDGPGKILGQAGPTRLRPVNAGSAAFLPAKGKMAFDTADLSAMEQKGTLQDVITHEMGHVLGIGTVWRHKGLLNDAGSSNPNFSGQAAMKEYGVLRGSGPTAVPVENTGGQGTADSHWRESVFRNELMTGFVAAADNPLSRLTIGSLQDLGYVVDMNAAEEYSLPNLLMMAESGVLMSVESPLQVGTMLPNIPLILPESSLQ